MSFKQDLKQLIRDIRHPLAEVNREHMVSEREFQAIKNLLRITSERLWLAEAWPKTPEYSTEYSQDLTLEQIELGRESIAALSNFVKVENDRINKERAERIQSSR